MLMCHERPLKLLSMKVTLEESPTSSYFDDCPVPLNVLLSNLDLNMAVVHRFTHLIKCLLPEITLTSAGKFDLYFS